jgi:tRNA threonylcarbamoyladenosine biosynthesis protein TsaE
MERQCGKANSARNRGDVVCSRSVSFSVNLQEDKLKEKMLKIISHNLSETQAIGEKLGELAEGGDLFLLSGNLGAGKTALTQGIARGLGSRDYALSPTFVLMRELRGRLPLYHIDLYRLDKVEEISDLGLDDYLYGSGLCVIEWAEKGITVLPAEYLWIKIDYLSDTGRSFEFIPQGRRYVKMMKKLQSFSAAKMLSKQG